MKSRITPDEQFPADLGRLPDDDVEVLNSKVHREIEHEVAEDGEVAAETDYRRDELREELDERDAGPGLTLVGGMSGDRGDDTAEESNGSMG